MRASIVAPTIWATLALGTFIASVGVSDLAPGGGSSAARHVMDDSDVVPGDKRPGGYLRLDPFGRPTCRTPLGTERRVVRIGEICP
jgi:hypothetical protein